eukprot:TRINITY_DN496_c0_g1_i4.p1 TRINITY_DN496_c0_g1~~TRINITY_DN496_c0_g1_i4.p1  ORF type:complete len:159 (+),score=17.61 TRINITY_DN496_c0_g1_i4:84-560(+)
MCIRDSSNSESRSSAGQFSIGSLRMSDVRLSLPNREENGEEETQNPFEQTAQTSPVEKETHTIMKGCNCKKTQCLRGYCECFIRKEMCTTDCNCIGCHNTRENATREMCGQRKGCGCSMPREHALGATVIKRSVCETTAAAIGTVSYTHLTLPTTPYV